MVDTGNSEQHHQAAHGGRAFLGDEVRLRTIAADGLALALHQTQMIDDPGPNRNTKTSAVIIAPPVRNVM